MAIRQFLFKPKPTAVVLALKDSAQVWYPSRLAQHAGASYVYVTHWLAKLEKSGWVKMEKKGRLQTVTLTERGMAIAMLLDELVKKIEMSKQAAAAMPAPVQPEMPHESAGKEKAESGEKKERGEKEKGAHEAGEKKEKSEKK